MLQPAGRRRAKQRADTAAAAPMRKGQRVQGAGASAEGLAFLDPTCCCTPT